MADQRISQLNELSQGSLAASDLIPIVDSSSSETKKITAKSLFQGAAALADSGSIDIIKLDQNSTTKLAAAAIGNDAITAAKLADDSSINYGPTEPTTDNFEGRGHVNNTTKYLKVFDGSVYQQVIAPTAGIEDLAVTTGKLAANAVTTAKIDASGLAAAALATDAVTTVKIQALAVTESKLAAGAVTETKIGAGAVVAAKMATDSVATASIIALNVTEAKLAAGAVTETKLGTAAVTVTKIADTSITYAKLNVADNVFPGAKLVDTSVTAAKLTTDSVSTAKIIDLAVTTGKLAASAVTTAKLAAGAVTATEIATDAVTTAKIIIDAVTYDRIQNVTATDRLLGRITAGVGDIEEIICTAAGRALLDDADATAQRTTLGLGTLATQSGTVSGTHSGTSSGSNTGDQTITLTGDVTGTGTGSFATTIAENAVTTAKLPDGVITTAKVADGAVTAVKLAASSTTVIAAVSPNVNGVFVGQQWFNTVTGLAYGWDGAAWTQQAGVQSFVFTDTTPLTFDASINAAGVATITSGLETQTAATVLSGPTIGSAAAPTFRALISTDLPNATASVNGVVQPGEGLAVTAGGVLNHTNTATPGTYTKVTVDEQGHVSTGTILNAEDIPELEASKITSGTFAGNLIGTNTITGEKLADQSTVQFGGAGSTANIVTFPTANFTGQLFWDQLNSDLYISTGVGLAWLPVTVTSGELILAGTFNASTGTTGAIAALTAAGTAAGFAIGALPSPQESNKQFYFVVSIGGTPTTGQVSGVELAPPDNILSTGVVWQKIDVSATVVGSTAAQIGYTAGGGIDATDVQAAIQELDTEKIPKALNSANILVGNGSNVAIGVAVSGDVTITNAGITAIGSGVIVNGDIADATITDAKLATIATAGKVSNSATTAVSAVGPNTIVLRDASNNFSAGTITANLTGTASASTTAAACTGNAATVTTNANLTGDVTSTGNATSIAAGVIINADINASAAIVDTKLAQITTAGKVSGTAITTGNISTSGSITTTSTLSVQEITVGKGAGAISNNTVLGNTALGVNTTGFENTAIGKDALFTNTTGSSNTACGVNTLFFNVSGIENTALGSYALQNNTTGNLNAATGQGSLFSNTIGDSNSAYGAFAIYSNTTGDYNTATGTEALKNNTTGITNTANGLTALFANTTGSFNTAIGASSLFSNTTGTNNTAIGLDALVSNTTGSSNTANGYQALGTNTTGTNNTAIGQEAGFGSTVGSNNTFVGFDARGAFPGTSNAITLGNGSITTLRCQVTAITALSDARDKTNITNLPAGLDFINALRPVAFDWNTRDGKKVGIPEFGFIAQELQDAQAATGITVPNLVSAENPDRLEASAGTLLPVLVNAVQELTAMVRNLESKLFILEGA